MRHLLRVTIVGLALVFGLPAAALLLAHLGVIRMPRDAYLSPVTDMAPATVEDYARVLAPLDEVDTPPMIAARAAITEASAHLPGYHDGLDRDWTFHRVSRTLLTYRHTSHAHASARVVCDSCGSARESRLLVSAHVVSLQPERAHVDVAWVLTAERPFGPSAARQTTFITGRGRLRVTLERAAGEWRAVRLEPLQ
jgi:hypothetical protein